MQDRPYRDAKIKKQNEAKLAARSKRIKELYALGAAQKQENRLLRLREIELLNQVNQASDEASDEAA